MKRHSGPRFSSTKSTTVERDGATRRENLDSGMRYDYARLELEDAGIVSYNKELLTPWDGHINVQRVTQLGLVRYLVKYVSKVEPTFTTRVKDDYARLEREDAGIVSYNKELLTAWDSHINVQRVAQLGLVRYLVKYVSKVEPTFTTRVKESVSEVEKYFTTRLIGAPVVATTPLSFQIAGSTGRVVFLDTNLPGQLNKALKPMAHIRRLEDESTDVF